MMLNNKLEKCCVNFIHTKPTSNNKTSYNKTFYHYKGYTQISLHYFKTIPMVQDKATLRPRQQT